MASDPDTPQSSPLVPGEGTHSSVHLNSVFAPSPAKSRPHRNLKKLSLTIPATPTSSGPATASFLPSAADKSKLSAQPKPVLSLHPPTRRASIVSLPPISSAALYRKDEVESPSVPYRDGPIQVIPHLWIGDEDNARDWKSLWERGIKSILNVAKELPCPLQHQSNPLRCAQSTSNLGLEERPLNVSTYYPPHLPSGRPGFHYLKLPWSHGQTNLVKDGFPAAMQFIDEAIARGDGVLVQ
jgi:tyrosine-protein phosphatase